MGELADAVEQHVRAIEEELRASRLAYKTVAENNMQLAKEAARLRETLETIASRLCARSFDGSSACREGKRKCIVCIARAAFLEEKP